MGRRRHRAGQADDLLFQHAQVIQELAHDTFRGLGSYRRCQCEYRGGSKGRQGRGTHTNSPLNGGKHSLADHSIVQERGQVGRHISPPVRGDG
jgi:hypothetical protein